MPTRTTRQKVAILRALDAAGRALTVAEIHEAARGSVPGLGVRTVYRQVRELVDGGQLLGVDYPGQPLRYERPSPGGHHAHLVCRGCGRLFDLPGEPGPVPFQAPPGYVIDGEEVIFYGWCPECLTAADRGVRGV